METKKYYLHNDLVWKGLTEEQMTEFKEKEQVEIDGVVYTAAPRLNYSGNNRGTVEIYEVSDNNVLFGNILVGVSTLTGDEGHRVGINSVTMPVSTIYFVRVMVSASERYCNNRFFPDIVDAIEYFDKIRDFIEGK